MKLCEFFIYLITHYIKNYICDDTCLPQTHGQGPQPGKHSEAAVGNKSIKETVVGGFQGS